MYILDLDFYFIIYLLEFCNRKISLRVPLEEQELPTLPEHLSLPPVFSRVRVALSFLVIVLSVLLRFTAS